MKGDMYYYRALSLAKKSTQDNLGDVFSLLEMSFGLGNHKSAYALGTWYLYGKHVKQNYRRAVGYLKYAAEGNLPVACYDLAICYENGTGVKRNLKRAFQQYVKSFVFGYKKAGYEVGRCYYYGIGVSKNKKIAQIWLDSSEDYKDEIGK
jgi:uncharacterized protein